MGFAPEEIADLLATTLKHYERELDYALAHNEYFWTQQFEKDAVQKDGGSSIHGFISLDDSANASYRSLYDVDSPNTEDTIHEIDVHWALIGTHASWDEFEIANQKNNQKRLIDVVHTKMDRAMISLADLIETTMVSVPDSATDRKHPFTLPYFLRVLNSAGTINTTAGFNGTTVTYGDASTGTIVAGIDSAVESRWRNWAAPYTAINNAFLKTARQAFIKTHYRYPLILDTALIKKRAKKMRAVAGTDTVLDLMDLVDTRDDNHVATGKESFGNMLVADGDLVRINRVPVIPLDTLDSASYTPIYFFDLQQLQPFVHEGYWMVKKKPVSGGNKQHTVFTSFVDGAHNILPRNMQKLGFVLHKTS